ALQKMPWTISPGEWRRKVQVQANVDIRLQRHLRRPLRILHEDHSAGRANCYVKNAFENAVRCLAVSAPVVSLHNEGTARLSARYQIGTPCGYERRAQESGNWGRSKETGNCDNVWGEGTTCSLITKKNQRTIDLQAKLLVSRSAPVRP